MAESHDPARRRYSRAEALAAIDVAMRSLGILRGVIEWRDPARDAELRPDLYDEAVDDATWLVTILRLGYGGAIDFADLRPSELGKE